MAEKSLMNVKQARQILGDLATNISDEQLALDIQAAETIKNLFFQHYLKDKNSLINYNDK